MAVTADTRGTSVARPDLVERISTALGQGSVMLVAAAGYGKTMALQQSVARWQGPTAWVSCTSTGGDAGRLLLTLLERLRRAAPGSVDVLVERLAGVLERVDVAALGRNLRSELEQLLVEPLLVVLDDAEELEVAPEAVELVDILLHTDPSALRLAVATRRPLPLRTAKLRAAGGLSELGPDELAFRPQECSALLAQRYGRPPSEEEVAAVMASTEGWPLGVALSAFASSGGAPSPQAGREAVFEFLEEEVLRSIEGDLRTAVLDSAAPLELCEAMLPALGLPVDFPARAQRAGLPLRRVQGNGGCWSYHPLLREFLRSRLAAERSQDQLRELHARVAQALTAADRGLEAIKHWLDAGRWRDALAAAESQGHELLRTSPDTVRGWLERLPPEAANEPGCQFVLGQLDWGAGRHEQSIEPLRAAVRGYDERGELGPAWLARWILCDALFSLGGSGYDEILQLSEGWDAPELAFLDPLPSGVAWYSALILMSRGGEVAAGPVVDRLRSVGTSAPLMTHFDRMFRSYVHMVDGSLDAGIELLTKSVEELGEYDPSSRASYPLGTLGYLQLDCGRRADALEAWERCGAEGEKSGLAFVINTARRVRALILAQSGDLVAAEAELRAADPPDGGGFHDRPYYGARATIALLRHKPQEAVAAAEQALEIVRPLTLNFRLWTVYEMAPVLVGAGAPSLALAAIEDVLHDFEKAFPDRAYPKARLLALRAWIRDLEGDTARADADLRRAWEQAQGCEQHVVRAEWERIERLVGRALEQATLDPGAVVVAVERAFPGGAGLVRFVDHPLPEVRRAALGPAVASGHPAVLARLEKLADDPDLGVAAAARSALDGVRRAPPSLHFTLLGGFAVRRATWEFADSDWSRPLAARLVRFLLVNRDAPVPEDVLFESFWPDKDPAAARRNLAVAVSHARRALDVPGAEDSVIHLEGRTCQLRLRPHDHVDADEFDAAATRALAADGAAARSLLEGAEALWTGEPLPEDRYSQWTFAWRERLVDLYAQLLAALTREYTNAGAHENAIRSARKYVEVDPLNEAAQRELIASYARAGRRGHALRQCLACRRSLIDELGVEPSEATARLQEKVLAGAPV